MPYLDELVRQIDAQEQRIIALARATGHPELAKPFPRQPRRSEHQPHPATDHSGCLPLEKFDRCRRCGLAILNNQPFHIEHDNCDQLPDADRYP